MKQAIRLSIGLIVLLGIVGTFILYLSWPLITGKTVILATRPVDPFDILMGQYLNINYEISDLPMVDQAQKGNEIFIILEQDKDNVWRYQETSLTLPRDKTFIKGRITSIYGHQMHLEYGIEQYFFERNAQLPTTDLTIEVKISGSGQARISKLLHQGKPLKIDYKEIGITS